MSRGARRRLGALGLAVLTGIGAMPAGPAAAQMMRGPNVGNFSVGPRSPSFNVGPGLSPTLRTSPNLYGEEEVPPPGRRPKPRVADEAAAGNEGGKRGTGKGTKNQGRREPASAGASQSIAREVVIEVAGTPTDAEADAIARRHRLTRLQSQSFPLIGSTLFRWRIPDGRPVDAVIRALVADGSVRSAQPNYRFTLQQAAQPEGDPAQYALAKLRLPEAHRLSRGTDIVVAVIDSGIDVSHPELAGVIGETFDPVGGKEAPHVHGTGIAAVIAAHGRLLGGSPSASLLAIRAFSVAKGSAESNSFALLRSLDFAVSHGARIVNMSFAGPQDPLMGKALAAAAAKGVVLIAASGNAGAASPPLYPAADRNVIAVSATDAADKLFAPSNRGRHIAVAAPGADILTAAPEAKYQVTSGTSFAAAQVSAVVALMLERNPALGPADVRAILARTARDLGTPGPDEQFGAGAVDALAAVTAAAAPVATAGRPDGTSGSAR
jgi:subtilisin family serine protease